MQNNIFLKQNMNIRISSCMHNMYNLFIYYTFNTCDISATYFADFLWTCFGAVEQTSEEQIKDLFLFFSEINIFKKNRIDDNYNAFYVR